ncbi:Rib/alpha-like domain-containing protein, partial [Staphylococcus auricularis]
MENSKFTEKERRNRYSIRKFSVGTASLLIGATLIFGIGNHAQASEVEHQESNVSDSNKDADTDEDTVDAEAQGSVETAPATEASSQDVTEAVEAPEAEAEEASPEVSSEDDASVTEDSSATESTESQTEAESTEEEPESDVEAPTSDVETPASQGTSKPEVDKATEQDSEASESTEAPGEEAPGTETEETTVEEEPQSDVEAPTSHEVVKPEVTGEAPQATPNNKGEEAQSTNHKVETAQPAKEQASTSASQAFDIEDVNDKASAAAYYASVTNVSTEEAQKVVDSLELEDSEITPESFAYALAQRFADEQARDEVVATLLGTTREARSTAVTRAANEPKITAASKKVIEADAIKNGYIKTATDATNAANTLSGRAWLVDKGTPATMTNGLTPVPEGTKVYLQFMDTDGAVSPTYSASTTNKLSNVDGSQVGPGAYAFDLRQGWVDANGKLHKFSASPGQRYRIWINDFKTGNGNTASMLRVAGGFFPGTFVNSTTGNNLGQFQLVGTNMQRTGIFMSIQPTNGYMTKNNKQWIHDTQGPLAAPAVVVQAKNTISGHVWLETGAGDEFNSATGPNKNLRDPAAAGYTVVMSSLTKQGGQAYKAQIERLPDAEKAAATKRLLTQHPEYISATVYGETDAEGKYTLRFPNGTLDDEHVYGYVLDKKGNIIKAYSSFTTPEFRAPNSNLSFTPQAAPAQNLFMAPMWYNVNFAVVESSTDVDLNIVNYNNTDKPAVAGDKVNIDITGTQLSPLPTRIEWRDKTGRVVKNTGDITSIKDGETKGTFTVPSNVKDGDVYTAILIVADKEVAADSFVVKVTNAKTYEPTAKEVTKDYGTPVTEDDVKRAVTVPKFPTTGKQPTVTIDDPSQLPNGNTPGRSEVDVTVGYPDGSTDKIKVPVTIGQQSDASKYEPVPGSVTKDYGTPVTADEVTSAVTVPNFPANGKQPTITVDDPSTLPNGNTAGRTEVPVTVGYPDGTTDKVKVPVIVGEQPNASKYEPNVNEVTKDYGTPVTADEVTSAVTVPNFPANSKQPTITVDDPSTLPNGNTEGTTEVDVTVGYPDGTKDKVKVPVTIGKQSDASKYEPVPGTVNKDHGTPVTVDEVTSAVTVPNYPTTGDQPTITVDDPSQLPNGNTEGTTEVDVTVGYPDGTKDKVKVPVTIGKQSDASKYEPVPGTVNKDHGTPVTADEVTSAVTVPNYPTTGDQPTITVDDPSQLPNGNTEGTTEVDVTVGYPDGTKDKVKVPVTIGKQSDASKYEPVPGTVTKDHGTPVTPEDITNAITIPNYPTDGQPPKITFDSNQVPDGNTPGTTEVDVTVEYPDGSKDKVKVPVTVGKQSDASKYEPVPGTVTKDHGTPVTPEDITNAITIPNYPTDGKAPKLTFEDSQIPNGNTEGTTEVDVTVEYPDGSTDKVKVPVTIGKQSDASKYEPVPGSVNKDHGTPVTPEDITNAITIPNYPTDGQPPKITFDPNQVPDGNTPGTTEVDVTVEYPDGSKDKVKVPVTVGKQSDASKYEPVPGTVTKDHGTPATPEDITNAITIPNYPTDGQPPKITFEDSQIPNGNTEGTTEVDVTVEYPDGSKDHVKVPVTIGKQSDASKYEPVPGSVNKDYGTPVTPEDITNAITIPNYPTDGKSPKLTFEDSQIPNGNTEGTTEVDVTVEYPDGSKDKVKVPVTIGKQSDASKYEPVPGTVTKDHGTPVTPEDITNAITIPNYPTDGKAPKLTFEDSQIPNGNTEGTTEVDVTVEYPDGSTDKVKVPVTIGKQSDASKYEPVPGSVNKDHGTPVTPEDITNAITIPNYPTNGQPPKITFEDSQIPNGNTEGTTEVDVTVEYPDGSTDKVKVPVTIGKQSDASKYEPVPGSVNKDYGTPVTPEDITNAITIPNYPTDGKAPKLTFEDSQIPNGNTEGTTEVDVTVEYPDGSKDHVKVPVTIGKQSDASKYEPVPGTVTKDHGTPVTPEDITNAITIPNYPTDGKSPKLTFEDSQIPNGNTSGTTEVDVTVEYPDGSKDHVKVPVTIGKQSDASKYEPVPGSVNKDYGTPVTPEDITNAITIPNYPTNGQPPKITFEDSQIPNGNTEGTTEVDVTVEYPDGSKDKVKVPVTIGKQSDASKYEPVPGSVNKDHGTPVTPEDITNAITIPNYPTDGKSPKLTFEDSQIPNGNTPGTYEIDVTVEYPDGSKDHVKVPVTIGKQSDASKYEPVPGSVNKDHGTPVTPEDITNAITIPNYPTDGKSPKLTFEDSQIPNGNTPGTYEIDVTVEYPDGSKDHVKVPITIGKETDASKYEPVPGTVTKDHGTPVTPEDIANAITIPNYPTNGKSPKLTFEDSQIPNGNTSGTYEIDVTVEYPDGSKDHVKVPITIGKETDASKYEPVPGTVTKDHGTPVTPEDITNAITIPNYPTDGKSPKLTFEDSQIPNGNTEGTTEVDVTVEYPDGSKDKVKVPVTIGKQSDASKYEPVPGSVNKDHGTPVTPEDITNAITIPNYPTD